MTAYASLKRAVVGAPIATDQEHHQRLGKPTGLAVFASDAISSTAYATEEILLVLVPLAGLAALHDLLPIAAIVAVLLVIVISSYRQTIHAYPDGGGSYVVSRENLGTTPALVAGASLMVDYVLTAAVSISAGVAAITSAFPELRGHRVDLCLAFLALITFANLRGTKESGRLFAGPTYLYISSLAVLLLIGLFRSFTGDLPPLPPDTNALEEFAGNGVFEGITLLALLRAFSSGAVALTGIEAVSNGVPAFRKPEPRNAAQTLVTMGLLLGGFFFGISLLTERLRPTVSEDETLLSQLGAAVFGGGTMPYYVLQFATFAILILAANTAFADFPRVASILARDGFLPRQLSNRGDRLVFSNGILLLAAIAGLLIVAFGGQTSALIPLYAVGVFTGFTLSQLGMVRHHERVREPGWKRHRIVNGVGATATAIVLIVVVVSKFTIGAWIPAVLIPVIVFGFKAVRRHYDEVRRALALPPELDLGARPHTVVILAASLHRGVAQAIRYGRSLHPDRLLVLSVVTDDDERVRIEQAWTEHDLPVELRTVESPYRDLSGSVLRFIDELDAEHPDDLLTVLIPEFVVKHWWEHLLHNQSALVLRARLRNRPGTAVTAVPIHLRAVGERASAEVGAGVGDAT